jgi:hypothetical protein
MTFYEVFMIATFLTLCGALLITLVVNVREHTISVGFGKEALAVRDEFRKKRDELDELLAECRKLEAAMQDELDRLNASYVAAPPLEDTPCGKADKLEST